MLAKIITTLCLQFLRICMIQLLYNIILLLEISKASSLVYY